MSRKSIEEDFDMQCKTMMETSNHNPFLSEKGPQLVKKIHRYIGN